VTAGAAATALRDDDEEETASQVNLSNSAYGDGDGLDISVNRTSHILQVGGALDATTVGHFRPVADELLRDGCQQLVLDLAGLRLIDSVGIGVIIYMYRQLQARGGSLCLRAANGQPLAILQLMKLDRILLAGDDELHQLSG
jgi:anti-sigma B factor antagonist